MGYRRPEEAAEMARRWREFTNQQRQLFDRAGLPGTLMHDRQLFDYFLMHGHIADGSGFSAGQLDQAQWRVLDQLVEEYVSQFYDPGVALGPRPA